jgi:hypothetical protein
MLRIRYTAPLDLEISGSVQTLQNVSTGIFDLVRSDKARLLLTANTHFDPHPYKIAIPQLLITRGTDLLALTVETEAQLHIDGSRAHLEILADWFSFDPQSPSKTHAHFEYYDEHPFIASHSVPLVITVD